MARIPVGSYTGVLHCLEKPTAIVYVLFTEPSLTSTSILVCTEIYRNFHMAGQSVGTPLLCLDGNRVGSCRQSADVAIFHVKVPFRGDVFRDDD